MGYGYWTRDSFVRYSNGKGRTVDAAGRLDSRLTDQQIFTQKALNPLLNPRNVVRECCDSDDHPRSVPVILALDVTGSMGPASAEVAKKMNEVMTKLYGSIEDVEFLVMGIGDLVYDRAPIQISQFESDIRIAEQLDLVYMEHGGGGNMYESYTAAWYMGARHTRLDCWQRGQKGLIITMGDEPMNPCLPARQLGEVTGDEVPEDIDTRRLYAEVTEKYDVYHIHVAHRQPDRYMDGVEASFGRLLPEGHLIVSDINGIADALIRVITAHAGKADPGAGSGQIAWLAAPDAHEAPAPGEISWETAPEPMKAPVKSRRGLFGLFNW